MLYTEEVLRAPYIDHEEGTTSLSIVTEVINMGGGKDFIEAIKEVISDADSFGFDPTTRESVIVSVSFLNTHSLTVPSRR